MDKWLIPWVGEVEPLAFWGASVSTVLAAIKFYEFWRDRSRIRARAMLRGDPHLGNEITVMNLSSKPIIVEHWEIIYRGNAWWFGKEEPAASPWDDDGCFSVEAHGSRTLTFRDMDYFGWGADLTARKSIWIRLHVAGKWFSREECLYPFRSRPARWWHRAMATFAYVFCRKRWCTGRTSQRRV